MDKSYCQFKQSLWYANSFCCDHFFLYDNTDFWAKTKRVSVYVFANYNHTLYDYTAGNNPWGMGLGLQTFFNTNTKFKPTIELTGNIYLEDNKVLKLNPNGNISQTGNSVSSMVNVFAGSSFHPTQSIYISLLAGPSFIGRQTLLGIKPSFGFYFSKSQRWTGKISYLNVFHREKVAKANFGTISFAIGVKIF